MRLDIDFEHLGVAGKATWADGGKWDTDNDDLREVVLAAAKVGVWSNLSPTGPWVQHGTKTLEQFYATVRDWVDPGKFWAMADGYDNPETPPDVEDAGPTLWLETLGERLARKTREAVVGSGHGK